MPKSRILAYAKQKKRIEGLFHSYLLKTAKQHRLFLEIEGFKCASVVFLFMEP